MILDKKRMLNLVLLVIILISLASPVIAAEADALKSVEDRADKLIALATSEKARIEGDWGVQAYNLFFDWDNILDVIPLLITVLGLIFGALKYVAYRTGESIGFVARDAWDGITGGVGRTLSWIKNLGKRQRKIKAETKKILELAEGEEDKFKGLKKVLDDLYFRMTDLYAIGDKKDAAVVADHEQHIKVRLNELRKHNTEESESAMRVIEEIRHSMNDIDKIPAELTEEIDKVKKDNGHSDRVNAAIDKISGLETIELKHIEEMRVALEEVGKAYHQFLEGGARIGKLLESEIEGLKLEEGNEADYEERQRKLEELKANLKRLDDLYVKKKEWLAYALKKLQEMLKKYMGLAGDENDINDELSRIENVSYLTVGRKNTIHIGGANVDKIYLNKAVEKEGSEGYTIGASSSADIRTDAKGLGSVIGACKIILHKEKYYLTFGSATTGTQWYYKSGNKFLAGTQGVPLDDKMQFHLGPGPDPKAVPFIFTFHLNKDVKVPLDKQKALKNVVVSIAQAATDFTGSANFAVLTPELPDGFACTVERDGKDSLGKKIVLYDDDVMGGPDSKDHIRVEVLYAADEKQPVDSFEIKKDNQIYKLMIHKSQDSSLEKETVIKNGDVVRLGHKMSTFRFEVKDMPKSQVQHYDVKIRQVKSSTGNVDESKTVGVLIPEKGYVEKANQVVREGVILSVSDLTFGMDQSSNVIIDISEKGSALTMSAKQFEIQTAGKVHMLIDRSSNGIFVNRTQVDNSIKLFHGDKVSLNGTDATFIFKLEKIPVPPEWVQHKVVFSDATPAASTRVNQPIIDDNKRLLQAISADVSSLPKLYVDDVDLIRGEATIDAYFIVDSTHGKMYKLVSKDEIGSDKDSLNTAVAFVFNVRLSELQPSVDLSVSEAELKKAILQSLKWDDLRYVSYSEMRAQKILKPTALNDIEAATAVLRR